MLCLLLAVLVSATAAEPPRVRAARSAREAAVRALFARAQIDYPAAGLLLRAFKQEGQLEVWARSQGPLALIATYPICARSGGPGPKRRAGDGQVPEGFYQVTQLNPASSFLLSLRVSYPNKSDRLLGGKSLGGDIFIHGDCVTIGCIPIQDGPIQELYLMATDARPGPIDVHIFPARMTGAGWAALRQQAAPGLRAFWENLREGYLFFEERHTAPRVAIDARGRYSFQF